MIWISSAIHWLCGPSWKLPLLVMHLAKSHHTAWSLNSKTLLFLRLPPDVPVVLSDSGACGASILTRSDPFWRLLPLMKLRLSGPVKLFVLRLRQTGHPSRWATLCMTVQATVSFGKLWCERIKLPSCTRMIRRSSFFAPEWINHQT
ncbi:MAG: hypothetical protein FD135_1781 [Comamonadaceae bacterium]|nr:MAG: hypothetical protein FD135_1781 [Comamonadaceae bacterium]